MHLSLAISGPWLKTSPLDLIETLYGRTVEDCALVVPWPMERPSRKKCTRVLRYGGPKSTGTPLASVLVDRRLSFFSGNVTGGVGMLRGLCAQEYPTRAFAANDNHGHACWTASRPRQAPHIDGELPASTMREGAAMVLAGIENGEPGPGTLKIVTPPDMQERPIPYLATVKGLVASPVVDSSAKSPRPTSSSRYCPPRMREARVGIAFVTHPA